MFDVVESGPSILLRRGRYLRCKIMKLGSIEFKKRRKSNCFSRDAVKHFAAVEYRDTREGHLTEVLNSSFSFIVMERYMRDVTMTSDAIKTATITSLEYHSTRFSFAATTTSPGSRRLLYPVESPLDVPRLRRSSQSDLDVVINVPALVESSSPFAVIVPLAKRTDDESLLPTNESSDDSFLPSPFLEPDAERIILWLSGRKHLLVQEEESPRVSLW